MMETLLQIQKYQKTSNSVKLIKLLHTSFPLGFYVTFTQNVIFLKCLILTSLLDVRKRKHRSHGLRKNGNLKRKKKTLQ